MNRAIKRFSEAAPMKILAIACRISFTLGLTINGSEFKHGVVVPIDHTLTHQILIIL